MLTKKWEPKPDRWGRVVRKERDAEKWRESFSQEWAVVKFVKMEHGDGVPAPPTIVTWQEKISEAPRKSVNEMLAEMRLAPE